MKLHETPFHKSMAHLCIIITIITVIIMYDTYKQPASYLIMNSELQVSGSNLITKYKISLIALQILCCGCSIESSCQEHSNEYPN